MKRKKLQNLAILYIIMIIVMIVQTVVSYFFSPVIFVIFLCLTVAVSTLAIYRIMNMHSTVQYIFGAVNSGLETASNIFTSFALPVMITTEKGEVVWYNDAYKRELTPDDDLVGSDISVVIPDKERKTLSETRPIEIPYKDKIFYIRRSMVSHEGFSQYIYFFNDQTKLLHTANEYKLSRPVIAMITVDNFDELTHNMRDSEKATVGSTVEICLESWANESSGLLRRISNSRFMLIIEERALNTAVESRFAVLDKVRNIDFSGRGKATLSIGIGHDCENLAECETSARQALDMAQGRGGDQAAVKDKGNNYRFFGGVSKSVERRTRVKARVVASAIKELIDGSDKVVIMGHRFADLDCFGASVALWSYCNATGKEAYVVMNRKQTMAGELLRSTELHYGRQIAFEEADILPKIDRKTLLIVVDTHRAGFLDSRAVYDAAQTVVVIDHHRKAVDYIDKAVIFYHETAASSACEMTAEIIQTIGEKFVGQMEAEALLSGIMLDTKNFILHTGVRTFEASAFLCGAGGDPVTVKRLFSGSMEAYRQKAEIIAAADIYKDCAISICKQKTEYTRIAASQAADEMLNISGVNGGFVLFSADDEINISARSLGNMNVQLIMEQLGGGGHQTMAAAQVIGGDFDAAKAALINAINIYKQEEN